MRKILFHFVCVLVLPKDILLSQTLTPMSQPTTGIVLYIAIVLLIICCGVIFFFYRTRYEQTLLQLIEERTTPTAWQIEKERLEQALMLTEVSRAELVASEERYRNFLENINEVFQIVDAEGNITYASPNMEIETGFRHEEIIKKKYYEFIVPEDRRAVMYRIEQNKRDGSEKLFVQFRTLKKNGTIRWIEISGRIIRDINGTITEYHNVVRDIHDRKRAEEQLLTVFENMPIIVTALDAGNYVLLWNKAAERVTGYTAEEVIGNYRVMELFVPNLAYRRSIYKKLLRYKGNYSNWEIECTCKDGTVKTIAFSSVANLYPIPAYPGGWGIGIDVTERKKLEQDLLHAQKMESIGTLANGIAHDFNNILAIITGYAKLLQSEASDAEKVLQRGEAIAKSSERGAGLVRQLLTFARKTDMMFEHVHLNTLVEEVVIALQEIFPKNIILQMNIEPLMPAIKASGAQLHQVLLNLCVNARDAMPEGGVLTITTYSLPSSRIITRTHHKHHSDMYVCLSVNDTGSGMDETIKQRIYEPFYTTKERGRGTGLGLSVVYGIIQSHKGFIEVESTKDVGTTFSLYFPAQRENGLI